MLLIIHVCPFCVPSDSERGEKPFKGTAGLHRGPAASADTQFEGYDAYCFQLTPMSESVNLQVK